MEALPLLLRATDPELKLPPVRVTEPVGVGLPEVGLTVTVTTVD
jgi:hypothetical protein